MLGFDGYYPVVYLKAKFWRFLLKNCKKSTIKHSIEKHILLNFVNLSTTIYPKFWINYETKVTKVQITKKTYRSLILVKS